MKVKNLIAPCGMNCALCQAYQGKGLKCFGCGNMSKRKSCQNCFIFIHKDFKFQIWLSGINRNIQEKYFNIYKNTKYNLSIDPNKTDYILYKDLNFNYNNLQQSLICLKKEVYSFINDIINNE